MKKNKGITLVALVVTIVVLIILATISANIIFGEEGILEKVRQGNQEMANAQAEEKEILADTANSIDTYIIGERQNTELTDEVKEYIDKKIETTMSENELIQYNDIIVNSNGSLSISRVGNIVYFSGYYVLSTYTNNVNVIPEKYMPDGARQWCGNATGYGQDNNSSYTTSGVSISADGTITTNNTMSYSIYSGTYEIVSSN